ncbi:hypothetical protein CBR_g32278 [Chara braunii]|uniref:Uncharacterized protein n=1 Tax=Chara braunii TaxID=69332 RepID=A0A388JND6_CHABU|nr:hypothetical protein CBR_g32278 [Chara braunii]|eukprot:GBG59263.1 hypothetical protein CBR_g32278 [Chara braunii]
MEAKAKERHAKEDKLKEEEEKRKIQAAEEERAKAKREPEEFKQSIGKMVRESMKEVCAREQLEKQRRDELEKLRQENGDLVRIASGRANRELDSIKADNQALIHDFLALKSEVELLKRNNKRTSEAVTKKSPPVESAKGVRRPRLSGRSLQKHTERFMTKRIWPNERSQR